MRDFLKDLQIVGAMLASYEGKILHYTIPNLLQWCDWVLVMLDNETRETRAIVKQYKRKYPSKIRVAHTNLVRVTKKQAKAKELVGGQKGGYLRRYKAMASLMRESVFEYMRKCLKNGEKIDLLIFVDADEIFSDYLPNILKDFWEKWPDRRAISCKPTDVFGDMKTIRKYSMSPHVRIMKYSPEFSSIPYRNLACYYPLGRVDRWESRHTMIHLNSLLEETRRWRSVHWKKAVKDLNEPLWSLDKDIRQMTPREIAVVTRKVPNTTIGTYLRDMGLGI